MFGFVGVGVNLRPLSKSLVSVLLSFLEDKFTICISVLHAIFCCIYIIYIIYIIIYIYNIYIY